MAILVGFGRQNTLDEAEFAAPDWRYILHGDVADVAGSVASCSGLAALSDCGRVFHIAGGHRVHAWPLNVPSPGRNRVYHLLSIESVFGLPFRAFADLVIGFVVFGVVLQFTGGSQFFELAFAI